MQVLGDLEELEAACGGGVAMTIGVFDAVHRGHQMLMGRARDEGQRRGLKSLVFTFERHPLSVLAPVHCPPAMTQPAQKVRLIEEQGVDLCLMLRFTAEIAATEPETFVREILAQKCRARFIVCGEDFSFGAGGGGKVELLRERAEEFGYEIEVCDSMMQGASPISSTRLRSDLIDGHLGEVEDLLGRRYGIEAEVVTGDGRGRELGFPTANLKAAEDQLIPADGVYAVIVRAGGAAHGGMLNIGSRPTFEGAGRAIEVHLFDFEAELTGTRIEMEFIARVRDERKFDGVEKLIEQLKRDEQTCRELCGEAMG